MNPTSRLKFTKLQLTDTPDYHCLTGNAAVMEYITGNPYSLTESQDEVKRLVNTFGQHPAAGLWVARSIQDATFIGVGALIPLGDGIVDLGYRIHPEYWNQGYGYEIGQALLQFSQQHRSMHKLIASVAPNNIGSKKILERLGLKPKGKSIDNNGLPELNYELILTN